jgi:guanine deaminase
MMLKNTVYYGTLVHSVSIKDLEIIENGVLVVNDQGIITLVEKEVKDLDNFLTSHSLQDAKVKKKQTILFEIPKKKN